MKISVFVLTLVMSMVSFADTPDLPNLRESEPGIFRSGRPSLRGLNDLKKLNIKTIVDLEDDGGYIQQESLWANQIGFKFISVPMGVFREPNDTKVAQVEALLKDVSMRPILVHCQHGQDRTGLIIGLYRVFVDGWQPQRAYQEMLQNGFHSLLWELDGYFRTKTGMH